MVQTLPQDANSGSVAGVVLKEMGAILLTGSWDVTTFNVDNYDQSGNAAAFYTISNKSDTTFTIDAAFVEKPEFFECEITNIGKICKFSVISGYLGPFTNQNPFCAADFLSRVSN